jgi:hypothetical protein
VATPTGSPSGSPDASGSPDESGLPTGTIDEPLLFAVDLFAPDESNIAPGDAARITALGTDEPTPGNATAGVARDEFWPLLVTLALLFLAIEWLVYERDGARRIVRGVRAALSSPLRRRRAG